MKTQILTFLLFNLSLFSSPFILPAKKAFAATVRIHTDEKKQAGFFISSDGEILTLYHPLKDLENIIVEHHNHYYPATLLSGTPETDIALLQIPGDHFPYLEIASSRDIFPGEWALIAGFPMRWLSVRRTMISSLNKEFLIIDCPLNPGEFGGPLLNLDGGVIGVNCGNSKDDLGLSIPLEP